ncbi:MAG: signal peptide peptidase SppA [Methylocystis sp.]
MTSSSDYLLDRRRLRRKLGYWRLAAIAAALIAALIAFSKYSGVDSLDKASPHLARFFVEGMITGDRDTLDLIKELEESKAAGVLLAIDSPGGTTTGAEAVYLALRKLAEKKPTVAVVSNTAASGAYIAALGADRIFVRGGSLVGSIGVLADIQSLYKGLDMIGVKVDEFKSSPLKNAPNGFEPTSEAARAAIMALIDDNYVWFKGLVKERRGLTDEELAKVADGRVFTGRQAVPLKLADAFGGESEAILWLEQTKGVAKKLPIRDWKKKPKLDQLGILGLASTALRALGLAPIAAALEGALGPRASLDGVLAIWQAPKGY